MTNDDDDSDLFRKVMSDVRPLQNDRAPDSKPKPRPRSRHTRDPGQTLSEASGIEVAGDDAYARPHVNRPTLRRLRRGQLRPGDELDLHGLTVDEARVILQTFLDDAIARRYTCVRIIHGKGLRSGKQGPRLKPNVARWLREHDAVMAYAPARPVDGGSGALYVLLQT